jgi:hypothetical protein
MIRTGRAVKNSVEAQRTGQQVQCGRTLGAQRALVDWAARITLDMNDLAVTRIDELCASDCAISADAGADFVGNGEPCRQLRRFGALGSIRPITLSGKLAWQGPVAEKVAHCAGEAAAKRIRSVVRGCVGEFNLFGYAGHQMLGFTIPDSDVPQATGEHPQILRIEAQRM